MTLERAVDAVSEDPQSWATVPTEVATAGEAAAGSERLPAEIARMTFEQALAELEKIVQDLERGQLDLEAAITAYERGTHLKLHCEGKLREAQLRVDKISLAPDGRVRAEPTDVA